MKKSLNNKTLIITGASSGIGYDIVKYILNKYNAKIIGVARNFENLLKVKKEFGERFVPISLDVSKIEDFEKLVDFIKENNYEIYGVINCAGVLPKFSLFSSTPREEFFNVLKIKFNSIVYSAEKLLPFLRETNGFMVNVTSSSALCPFAGVSAYSTSKVAAERFSTILSYEEKLVRITTVMPGFTKTNIMRNQNANEKEKKLIDKMSSRSDKVAKIIVKKSLKGKRRVIVGFDAHMTTILYKLFPVSAPKIIGFFLKNSGIKMFKEIF